jgi:hypothetical protein
MLFKKLLAFRQRERAWAETDCEEPETVLLTVLPEPSGFPPTASFEWGGVDAEGDVQH